MFLFKERYTELFLFQKNQAPYKLKALYIKHIFKFTCVVVSALSVLFIFQMILSHKFIHRVISDMFYIIGSICWDHADYEIL